MIARIIAFALHQRFITLALALLLTVGGVVSWSRLPIEAYPDVADVQVDVITIWPGRAAEEVERLITIPIEKEVNGIAGITFLRSVSNFGLGRGDQAVPDHRRPQPPARLRSGGLGGPSRPPIL